MNITIAKKDLLHLASRASGIAERGKSTMPVLQMLLLDGEESRLVVSATDLYRSLVDHIPAEVTTPGLIAVGAKDLVDRVKMMPDGPLLLTSDDRALTVKAKGTARRYTLRAMPGGDFPPIPQADPNAAKLTLDGGVLSRLIALTKFSVATDETRPHLNSALLEWSGNTVRMVSTDGHRLSKAEATVDASASASLLIPLKALSSIDELADAAFRSTEGEEAGKLTIIPSGSSAFVLAGTAIFSVKLVDAQFPPYAQVIPASSESVVRVSRTLLADAVRAVSVAASERTGATKFSIGKGKILIESESAESGDGTDELPIEYSGKSIAIGFNARYVLDALGALDTEEVELGFTGELDPMVVKPVDPAGPNYIGVLMPIRI